jgi:NAD(P)-dependent dehydrogenase (short-subunit alcohol dehydrogenase family)
MSSRLFDVAGRHVLVTGGSRGIGEMIARGLVEAGAIVYVSSRNADACQQVADELGERAIAVPGDVSTGDGCRALATAVGEHTDHLDVLVNNAGATWGAGIDDYPDEAWDKVLGLNVAGPFRLTAACLDMLRASATPDDPARVVNIGSVDGIQIPAFESYAYSASKAAVHHLTRHMGQRLAREHITVNAIAPGLFESKMTKFIFEAGGDDLEQSMPMHRTGRQDDIAGAVIYLASPAAAWVTGVVLPVDGGFATLR